MKLQKLLPQVFKKVINVCFVKFPVPQLLPEIILFQFPLPLSLSLLSSGVT